MTPLTRAQAHLSNWYETHDPRELADALREVIGELRAMARTKKRKVRKVKR